MIRMEDGLQELLQALYENKCVTISLTHAGEISSDFIAQLLWSYSRFSASSKSHSVKPYYQKQLYLILDFFSFLISHSSELKLKNEECWMLVKAFVREPEKSAEILSGCEESQQTYLGPYVSDDSDDEQNSSQSEVPLELLSDMQGLEARRKKAKDKDKRLLSSTPYIIKLLHNIQEGVLTEDSPFLAQLKQFSIKEHQQQLKLLGTEDLRKLRKYLKSISSKFASSQVQKGELIELIKAELSARQKAVYIIDLLSNIQEGTLTEDSPFFAKLKQFSAEKHQQQLKLLKIEDLQKLNEYLEAILPTFHSSLEKKKELIRLIENELLDRSKLTYIKRLLDNIVPTLTSESLFLANLKGVKVEPHHSELKLLETDDLRKLRRYLKLVPKKFRGSRAQKEELIKAISDEISARRQAMPSCHEEIKHQIWFAGSLTLQSSEEITLWLLHKQLQRLQTNLQSLTPFSLDKGQVERLHEKLVELVRPCFPCCQEDLDTLNGALKKGKKIKSEKDGSLNVNGKKVKFLVPLCRGVAYLYDRWTPEAYKAHYYADDNSIAEAVYKTAPESFDTSFDKLVQHQTDLVSTVDYGFHHNQKALKEALLQLRKTNPIVAKINSDYHVFDNLLLFLQFIYSNGVERFLPFLKVLPLQYPEINWSQIIPNPYNLFVSFAEIFDHGLRYAFGEKNPYAAFRPRPRWRKNGKAEHPHIGKCSIGLFPTSIFTGFDRPNVLRYLREAARLGLAREVGPETEVAFLAGYSKECVFHKKGIRFPSFDKEYKEHYLAKYGLTKEVYDLFRKNVVTNRIPKQQIESVIESSLYEWLKLFQGFNFLVKCYLEASKQGAQVVYLGQHENEFSFMPPKYEAVLSEATRELDKIRWEIAHHIYLNRVTFKVDFKKIEGIYSSDFQFAEVTGEQIAQAAKVCGIQNPESVYNHFVGNRRSSTGFVPPITPIRNLRDGTKYTYDPVEIGRIDLNESLSQLYSSESDASKFSEEESTATIPSDLISCCINTPPVSPVKPVFHGNFFRTTLPASVIGSDNGNSGAALETKEESRKDHSPLFFSKNRASQTNNLLYQLFIWLRSIDFQKHSQERKLFNLERYDVHYEVGNCLFEAVAALDRIVPQRTGAQMRNIAMAQIRQDQQLTNGIEDLAGQENTAIRIGRDLKEYPYHSISEYLDIMGQDQAWGTEIELVALARALERPIVILTPSNAYDRIIEEEAYAHNIPMFLNYIGDNHYVPLTFAPNQDYRAILEEIRASIMASRAHLPKFM